MFSTIFNFEIRRWVKNPTFYVYCAIFFGLSLFIMASSLGAFDGVTSSTISPTYINSPLNIAGNLNALATLVYFLLPTIIGAAVYRDYQYNVYQVLFSYPLTKASYLSAKFLSSLVITLLVTFSCVLGFYMAQFMPNVNHDLLGPNNIWAYLQAYVLLIIPNMILFGLIIFAVVNYSRNIYVGFIFVLLLFVFQSVFSSLTGNLENRYYAALFDPFGFETLMYQTKYWSIVEKNNNHLPFSGVMLHNRLIWLGIAVVIGAAIYRTFSFSHFGTKISRKKEGKRLTKENFGSIVRVNLPEVKLDYSLWSRLKTAWTLSSSDFRAIIRNWTFIVIMVIAALMVVLVASSIGEIMGTETYPVTWKLLATIGSIYGFFITILILLFAGILIQRARAAKMDFLVDSTSVPNWVLLFSKFLALVKMTFLILLISMFTGIAYQTFHGFYGFEIGHYVQELFMLDMLKYLVYILFALFVHSFFKNYFVGFIICLTVFIGVPLLSQVGVEQAIFKFNSGPSYSYSDMNGYGVLRTYLYYRLYWLLFSIGLAGIALLFWRRGMLSSVKDRLSTFKGRVRPVLWITTVLAFVAFFSLGYAIYYDTNIANPYVSSQEAETQQVDYEKQYKRFEHYPAPRLIDVSLKMDIFPSDRAYEATVDLVYVNKTELPIDTLFISHGGNVISETISEKSDVVLVDTISNVKLIKLEHSLAPRDTVKLSFKLKSKPNSFLQDRAEILQNGTFMNNMAFIPTLAYSAAYEVMSNPIRAKYNLPPRDRMADPTDSVSLRNNYISDDADWIDFEAILSTSDDQIAIAPGYLQKEWTEDGRSYFHYKMDNKILNFYSIMSGRYEVVRDVWNDIDLEIYYHKGHNYNLERMMNSMKKSLVYYESNYSPYQFRQMRIIEFPRTHGTFAQAFANTVPFSEAVGFIAKVDEDDPNGVDYAYNIVSHEFAHQWWAHQVIGANVKGATLMSESLAEYSSLKVAEHTYGPHQMRRFLKDALDSYLQGRSFERVGENPLMYNENQGYIHYNKGSLVMYALSDLLGEQRFNDVLSEYIDLVGFQYPPYTTSIEFVRLLKTHTPDSLQYAIKDMLETITLYDNKIVGVKTKALDNGDYQVDVEFQVAKYRVDSKGKRSYKNDVGATLKQKIGKEEVESYPLEDYIEIAVFGEMKKQGNYDVDHPLYVKRYKIDRISNKVSIVVKEKPTEVGVDPFNKLIDTNSDDNRKKI